MRRKFHGAAWVGLCFALIASAAAAQEAPNDPLARDEILDAGALAAEVVSDGSFAFGQSIQTLGATNSGNTVTAETITNGDINIGSDAFSGFNGIGNFVMNTGNNNNLQGSIGVVVIMTPPP